ncbi:hypothetical protein [Ktedonospora formicarum]|uniref:Uncharacterized protein n=1 Tax=Ktedonospora formicarum TaxID=2778364 RepID=A0A8J3HXG7_9CHLR|nr:hypothetical protein [Ktedonospora formicarum]GHO45539.1 hypothetical protein KSX_37020 [Ktedonospora formicarum]
MTGRTLQTLHVRFEGRSTELPMEVLFGLQADASDEQVKQTVILHFHLLPHSLDDHVVIRSSNAIIVRPEAIYG